MSQIIPMPGYLLLDLTPPEKETESGIIMPEGVSEAVPNQAKVIAIGKPKPITVGDETGKIEIQHLQIGDTVIYREYGGQAVAGDKGKKLLICKDEDLLAVVKDDRKNDPAQTLDK